MKINAFINSLKPNMPDLYTCLYVFGCESSPDARTIAISTAIGKALAKDFPNIHVVTKGTFGASDIVADTFLKVKKSLCKRTDDDAVINITAVDCNNTDLNSVSKSDSVKYGKTLFTGECAQERNTIIARLLDVSILITGDKGKTLIVPLEHIFILFWTNRNCDRNRGLSLERSLRSTNKSNGWSGSWIIQCTEQNIRMPKKCRSERLESVDGRECWT